ncbi:hypothetical protein [Butyrivibrio sp. YAB3001]|uniref:hypothetical protein n=1 Tax=Butyrivibrio sp. YAB3001 TaxID=1520812 RepID=UPI0008F6566E|nr:hypothetical protein [Butyrivibrio sp. YAB3001]SFC86625.1 hypothetical protein SAMN02910398_03350 [Butyrivibrio sp. YAB3001]
MEKHSQKESGKKEIKIKKSPKEEALKRAPDEVIAKAIHDALIKEHDKTKK